MRRKDDEKEQRIRRSVITLMLKEGFNGTSIAKIAKMAGVSPATVYIYYENKEDMLQDIYLQYSDEVFDYLLAGIRCDMDGAQLIETLNRCAPPGHAALWMRCSYRAAGTIYGSSRQLSAFGCT